MCSWTTSPNLVHVQTVDFIAGTLGANDSDLYPALAGRATLKTLEGMAQAVRHFGAVLPDGSSAPRPPILTLSYYKRAVSAEQILATLLADGGNAGMTAYNIHEWHNTHNLGWIATVWTVGVGLLAVWMALWLSCQQRARRVRVLDVVEAFALGRPDVISNDEVFYLKHGRIVKESDM